MKINNYTIEQLNERLENTVPTKQYVNVVKALRRCQELLGQAAAHVEDAEFKRELQVYAGSLDLFFEDLKQYPWSYVDITDGYNPVAHLRKLGVIPAEDNRVTRAREEIAKAREKLKKASPAKKKTKGGRK